MPPLRVAAIGAGGGAAAERARAEADRYGIPRHYRALDLPPSEGWIASGEDGREVVRVVRAAYALMQEERTVRLILDL